MGLYRACTRPTAKLANSISKWPSIDQMIFALIIVFAVARLLTTPEAAILLLAASGYY